MGVDYQHRMSRRVAAFTRGWIGGAWDGRGRELAGEVLAGVRVTW